MARSPNLASLRRSRLPTAAYERDALLLARDLLGARLVFAPDDGRPARVARIVETEAYRGPTDRACHASKGLTKRTRTLLGPAGHAYVYLIYGMYDCFNVVGGGLDERGHAVLVRAIEPIAGFAAEVRTDGPGRLTRALGLDRTWDGASLREGSLFLSQGTPPSRIGTSARVGVAYAGDVADEPWRFFDPDSQHVSRPSPRSIGLGTAAGRR